MFTKKELKLAKWYDYLWLAIPIAGIAFFVFTMENRILEAKK